MSIPRFTPERTAVLMIDMQQNLLPAIYDYQSVEHQVGRLLDGAAALHLPLLATEQYVKGLGPTVPSIASRLTSPNAKLLLKQEKMHFSAATVEVRQALASQGIGHVLVCGIETHVCVLQTCLDLAASGIVTGVVVDAVGSRRELDRNVALSRLTQAGIIPVTVEMALLELTRQAGTPAFKALLPIIKN